MKLIPSLLLLATLAVVTPLAAQQTPGTTPSPGSNATDDVVNTMSGIKRPTQKPATTAVTSSGPKKGLEANLSRDEKGKEATSTFAASTPKIYLHFTDDSATKGEKLKAVWIAESAVGISTKNKKLTEVSETLPGPGAVGSFNLPAANNGFPVGKYRVELFEGSKLARTLKFTITK